MRSNGLLIGEVCRTAFRLVREHGGNPSFGYHYLGYLDLAIRSLERLLALRPKEGEIALQVSGLKEERPALEKLLLTPEANLLKSLRSLPG